MRYRTETPATASEVFDTEAVIANYESGAYYSLGGVGVPIWQALQAGLNEIETVNWLAQVYPDRAAELPAVVNDFVARLQGERLIIEDASRVAGPPPPVAAMPFGVAQLERFDDLKDLLLLDPVHDVDATGWPHLPEQS